jgi:hypothetical protein
MLGKPEKIMEKTATMTLLPCRKTWEMAKSSGVLEKFFGRQKIVIV